MASIVGLTAVITTQWPSNSTKVREWFSFTERFGDVFAFNVK
jgi:hypothetical protein